MKIVTLALIAAGLLLAQDKKAEKAESRTGAAAGAASTPKLPDGAKEVEPGLYRYTDPQGKVWLYRNTPFGLAKWEDKPVTAAPVVQPVVPVLTTDLGDSVQFERQTPFGPQKWTKKKTALTEEEKNYLKKEDPKRPEKPQPDKNMEKPTALSQPVSFPSTEHIALIVGRTPWSAAGPLAGPSGPATTGFSGMNSGSRGTRADQGVRPTEKPNDIGQDCPPHKNLQGTGC